MMKKFLIFMLVLGMASVATATLQISVDGEYEPHDSTIYLDPTGVLAPATCILDIWNDANIVPSGAGEGNWLLMCDTALGTITNGVAVAYGDVTLMGPLSASESGVTGMPEGYDGEYGAILLVGVTTVIPVGTKLFDEILFTCMGQGDVLITLERITDGGEYPADPAVLYDSVTIHQIPEPATIALLGLGGLLLRRRK
jgi:hypothetical protein